jgi:hypothetical protein
MQRLAFHQILVEIATHRLTSGAATPIIPQRLRHTSFVARSCSIPRGFIEAECVPGKDGRLLSQAKALFPSRMTGVVEIGEKK